MIKIVYIIISNLIKILIDKNILQEIKILD